MKLALFVCLLFAVFAVKPADAEVITLEAQTVVVGVDESLTYEAAEKAAVAETQITLSDRRKLKEAERRLDHSVYDVVAGEPHYDKYKYKCAEAQETENFVSEWCVRITITVQLSITHSEDGVSDKDYSSIHLADLADIVKKQLIYRANSAFDEYLIFKNGGEPRNDPIIKKVDVDTRAAAEGDPHFKSFSGNWFDYHGECDLVLMDIPNFHNDEALTVHVRTTIRYHYSYISSIAARFGDDVFEVSSFGDYALNGIQSANLDDAYFGGYPLVHTVPNDKTHLFKLDITDEKSITFKTFKDLTSIEVNGELYTLTGHGILGDLQTGKLLGRDGKTVFTDMNAFGQEWQVRDNEPKLFRMARAPQYPEEKCRLPTVSASDKRRLGESMAREKAEIACGRFTGVEFDNCVFDVMAVNDIDIAKAGAL